MLKVRVMEMVDRTSLLLGSNHRYKAGLDTGNKFEKHEICQPSARAWR